MHQYSDQLKKQALIDLSNRAKSGISLYPIIWLIITLSYQFHTKSPAFFYTNSAILLVIFVIRVWHLKLFKQGTDIDAAKMYRWLVYLVLISGLHWGLMFTFILLYWDIQSSTTSVWILVTISMAIGGSMVLSISNKLRSYYPMLLILPGVCSLIIYGGTDQWVVAAIGIATLIYLQTTTKLSHDDYWDSVKNRFLAEKRARKMERLSYTDQLTQLNNRMYFDQKFAEEWKRSSRSQSPLSILMLDLDYFKVINDSYGHVFGDECLRQVAVALLSTIQRETDSIARYGGEEFVVLLPDTNQQDSEAIATKAIQAIANIGLYVEGLEVSLTCSIGIATGYAQLDQSREILLKSADDALYLAKNKGRNRVQIGSTINA